MAANTPPQLQDRPAQPKPEIGQLLLVIRKWKTHYILCVLVVVEEGDGAAIYPLRLP
jgi:hypothetical protein